MIVGLMTPTDTPLQRGRVMVLEKKARVAVIRCFSPAVRFLHSHNPDTNASVAENLGRLVNRLWAQGTVFVFRILEASAHGPARPGLEVFVVHREAQATNLEPLTYNTTSLRRGQPSRIVWKTRSP